MKNVSVRWKMIILALITLIGTLAIGVLAVNRMLVMEEGSESVLRTSIEDDYDENIKNQVDCAISLLNEVYEGYERGEYSLDKAKEMGASLLRDLRYGDGGYFWQIPMRVLMWFFLEIQLRALTVWMPRIPTVIHI